MTDAGILRGTMVAMDGTVHGTIPGMHHGTIPGTHRGMILGMMAATMDGRHHGAMVGTAAITIVHWATITGILLFIIVVDAAIDRRLTTASTPIVM